MESLVNRPVVARAPWTCMEMCLGVGGVGEKNGNIILKHPNIYLNVWHNAMLMYYPPPPPPFQSALLRLADQGEA